MSSNDRFDLEDKVVVVTGGSRGIGRAIVHGVAAAYLASDAASYTTGATIRIDGGLARKV